MSKSNDLISENSHHEDKLQGFMRNVLIIAGVVVLASILGAISGKFLLDNLI